MSDKSTVISIVPFQLNEPKPGLYPGNFHIPAAARDDIEFLVVGRSVHYVYLDSDRGSLAIPTPSEEVARSIVDDYKGAQLGYSAGQSEPGIFWVSGEYKDKKAILTVAKDQIENAKILQKQWFVNLVQIADDEWNKHHSHKMVSDLQRYASKFLGLEKEWNIQATADSNTVCPACRVTVPVGAIICSSCRTVIDPKAYKEKGFQQVSA